MQIRYNKYT